MDKLSKYLSQPIFKKLFQVAEYSKLSKKEKEMYDASLKRKWDAEAVRQYLEDQAQQIEDARNQVEEERKKADDAQKKADDAQKKAENALKAAEDAQREERANSEITVRNLIEVLGLADNVIVRIANVSLEFVQEIRTTLGEKK